jgi:hypothetical protein
MGDLEFFQTVVRHPDLVECLARHGLDRIAVYGRGGNRNDGMKFSKPSWLLPCAAAGIEGIDVHLEARKPGELQLDVEVYPYEGSIIKNADRQRELREPLALKAEVLDLLRRSLKREWDDIEATAHGLLSTDAINCLCAVKFISGLGPNCSVDAYVMFLLRALDDAVPKIDHLLAAQT